jgi:hypothetical protein
MFKRRNVPTGTREDPQSVRARLDRAMHNELREQDRVFAEGLWRWSGRAASEGVSQVRVANPESVL